MRLFAKENVVRGALFPDAWVAVGFALNGSIAKAYLRLHLPWICHRTEIDLSRDKVVGGLYQPVVMWREGAGWRLWWSLYDSFWEDLPEWKAI